METPRERTLDASLALLREGYGFMSARFERFGSDLFETRLMLQPVTCLRGPEAARLFYDEDRFVRSGAVPGRVQRTFLGQGGVQTLDGEEHRWRKATFVALLTPERIADFARLFEERWRDVLPRWEQQERVVFQASIEEILFRAASAWTGVPVPEPDVRRRTRMLAALVESPMAAGPRYWRGRAARRRANRWLGRLVQEVRQGRVEAPEGSALAAWAFHRQPGGELLPARTAAVELVNLLRPIVAIGRYLTFSALALHDHPLERDRVQAGGRDYSQLFLQEVRRHYPFFPFVGARVRQAFEWRGHRFPRGRLVLLDLYGTNHDHATWEAPDEFRPERHRDGEPDPFALIPQGGGDPHRGHRCAGEALTVEAMHTGLRMLTREMAYTVPPQDLEVRLSRIPALPRSGFVMTEVRRTGEAPPAQ